MFGGRRFVPERPECLSVRVEIYVKEIDGRME